MWVLTETGFCEAQQIALQILGNSPPVGVDSALSKRDVKLREPEFNSITGVGCFVANFFFLKKGLNWQTGNFLSISLSVLIVLASVLKNLTKTFIFKRRGHQS